MSYRYWLAAILLSVFASGFEANAARPLTVRERARLNQEIAKVGSAATVGIYCKRGKHEGYYGTGAVITAKGHILTSTTVVPEGSRDIEIFFTDRKKRVAKIVEINEELESTLLQVEGVKDLPFLSLAKELPVPGDRAYTFGNPRNMIRLGDGASFSVGVISGVYEVKSADAQSTYAGLAIETDAAINPGQDGGPILDASGRLLGIISLSYSNMRWQGMAVPITRLHKELKTMKDLKLRTKAAVKAPDSDTAKGNKLAQAAKKLSKSLVAIEIERTYPEETLPLLEFASWLKTVKNYDQLTPPQQQRLRREFGSAEKTFEANRQLRRPDAPVTGMLVSEDGLIATSLFNLNEDKVMLHKQKGLQKIEYKGKLLDVLKGNPKDYKQELNKIKAIHVVLPNGERVKAKIHSRHLVSGLALLKAETKGQPAVDLAANAADIKLGMPIGVLGTAAGSIPYTLNTGIVSAEERSRGYKFQFDALINYGNSGGPVFTEDGKIAGFVLNPMSGAPIMGRVLPMQQLQRWLIALNGGVSFGGRIDKFLGDFDALKKGKSITKLSGTYIGLSPRRQALLSDNVIVGVVGKNSPADKAGLKVGDQIVSVDGVAMKSWKQFIASISGRKGGDVAKVKIKRTGSGQYLQVGKLRVSNEKELKALFKTLKPGADIKAKYVKVRTGEFVVDVKLEERK